METINQRINLVLEESGLSKTDFGKRINVSQPYVSKMINTGNPSKRTINDICREFDVNREWLELGVGGMHDRTPREIAIAAFVGVLLNDGEDEDGRAFKRKVVSVISKVDQKSWEQLEKIVDLILDEYRE